MTVTAPARPGAARRPAAGTRRPRGRLREYLADRPAWPVVALLAGYPLWWVFGLADASVIIMAIPMALRMRGWHRTGRKIMVPPAFGLWLLFLVCAAAGIMTLGLSAPDTLISPVSNRLLSYANRGVTYGALTVILLYAGNLTERELPRRRLAWLLGLLGIYTTIGGLGGIADPSFKFASPLTYVLPQSIQSNSIISIALHPAFSQVTSVLGAAHGRPKAPFEYTNTWGNCLTILLPWLLVAWWSYGSRLQRRFAIAIVAIAIVPLVYSLNRTAWAGVALAVVYLGVRLAARGKLAVLGLLCAGIAVAGVVVVATPLQGIITARFAHQQSNTVRASLSLAAIEDANAAPFIGFGDTRHQQGSAHSIAIGKTSSCAQCGEYAIGSNGQLYLLQICSGWLGAGLYFAFFGYLCWRFRRDKSPYGMAGLLTIGLSFLYMFTYVAVTAPLEFTMVMVALLWKNDRWLRGKDRTADPVVDLAGTAVARPAGRA
jgi:hypothetical protein